MMSRQLPADFSGHSLYNEGSHLRELLADLKRALQDVDAGLSGSRRRRFVR